MNVYGKFFRYIPILIGLVFITMMIANGAEAQDTFTEYTIEAAITGTITPTIQLTDDIFIATYGIRDNLGLGDLKFAKTENNGALWTITVICPDCVPNSPTSDKPQPIGDGYDICAIDNDTYGILAMHSASAGSVQSIRFYNTTDGGTTWTNRIIASGSSGDIGQLRCTGSTWLAFYSLGTTTSFARSTDNFDTSTITSLGVDSLAGSFDIDEPDTINIYAATLSTAGVFRVHKSDDSGATFDSTIVRSTAAMAGSVIGITVVDQNNNTIVVSYSWLRDSPSADFPLVIRISTDAGATYGDEIEFTAEPIPRTCDGQSPDFCGGRAGIISFSNAVIRSGVSEHDFTRSFGSNNGGSTVFAQSLTFDSTGCSENTCKHGMDMKFGVGNKFTMGTHNSVFYLSNNLNVPLEPDAIFSEVNGDYVAIRVTQDTPPVVFSRDTGNVKLLKLALALTKTDEMAHCEGLFSAPSDSEVPGMDLTIDGLIITPCVTQTDLVLQVLNDLFTVQTNHAYSSLSEFTFINIDSKTANQITTTCFPECNKMSYLDAYGDPGIFSKNAVDVQGIAFDLVSELIWVVSAEGLRVFDLNGNLLLKDMSILGTGVEAYDDTVYVKFASGTDTISSYDYSNVTKTLTLNNTRTGLQTNTRNDTMQISWDGLYLVTWGSGTVYILNKTDLTIEFEVATFGVQEGFLDITNSYLFVATLGRIERWDVFDDTCSINGCGVVGRPNTAVNPIFTDESNAQDQPSEAIIPSALLQPSTFENLAAGLGLSVVSTKALVGMLFVIGLSLVTFIPFQSVMLSGMVGMMVVAVMAIVGFFPFWVIMFIFVMGAAVMIASRALGGST